MEFEQMNEAYREKHYPAGSVLAWSAAKNKNSSVILMVILVILMAALGLGLYYFLDLTMYHLGAGHDDTAKVGMVFMGVFALLELLCLLGVVKLVQIARRGPEAVLQKQAKACGVTVEELREFDRQAMQSDCLILKLTGAISAAMANQRDGLLTRDYLWLGDIGLQLLRRQEMTAACLYEWTYYANKKRIHCLSVAVANREGRVITAEADGKRGRALLEMLKGAHPALSVAEGVVQEGRDFDSWRKAAARENA